MHIFQVGDIIFRNTPRRRNLLILAAEETGTTNTYNYETDEPEVKYFPLYTVLDLDNGSTYGMDIDLEIGEKVA